MAAGDDDLPDPTTDAARAVPGVRNPRSQDGLEALMSTTCARIGVGRAGPRWRTSSLLLFQADHAVAKDAIYRQVDQRLLDEMGLFTVRTRVTDKEQYLLRPDLGRLLSDEGRLLLQERCQKSPTVQVVVGDGLSAAAIEANLKQITPVLEHGFQRAGIQTGTPFFVQYARVGLMNDINTIVGAEVIVYLIGERPGLGRATSMSVYLGYRPAPGLTDADRDVVCNIFDGGTNPLEAGAYVVQLVQQMLKHKASGVKLKLVTMDTSAAATGEAR
jgi:ethanolamine ammonia-lyase small subunit